MRVDHVSLRREKVEVCPLSNRLALVMVMSMDRRSHLGSYFTIGVRYLGWRRAVSLLRVLFALLSFRAGALTAADFFRKAFSILSTCFFLGVVDLLVLLKLLFWRQTDTNAAHFTRTGCGILLRLYSGREFGRYLLIDQRFSTQPRSVVALQVQMLLTENILSVHIGLQHKCEATYRNGTIVLIKQCHQLVRIPAGHLREQVITRMNICQVFRVQHSDVVILVTDGLLGSCAAIRRHELEKDSISKGEERTDTAPRPGNATVSPRFNFGCMIDEVSKSDQPRCQPRASNEAAMGV